MALPRIYQKLFQNEGAGTVLRTDILPPAQSVAVADVNLNSYSTAGEYIVTGDKLASDGYPYDTSDPVYLKVIEAGDTVVQYFIHNDDIQIRYKNAAGEWSSWKSYEALIAAGDNELASQIQQLKVNANTLLGKITVVESSVSSFGDSISENTKSIATLKTTTSTNTTNIKTNADDIAALKTDVSTNATNIATNASDIAALKTDVSTNASNTDALYQQIEDAYTYVSTEYTNAGGTE